MSDRAKSVALLTVGTEITTGEITNGNAAWLSQKLVDLGYIVTLHLAVADDRPMIQAALGICVTHSSLVLVTGGLGPTSDDFTREEVARFIGRPLQWDEPSWQHIITRLHSLNTVVAESNKQQCWFPEGSEILPNPEGTAAGFYFHDTNQQTEFVVLPGPPREIEVVWNLNLHDRLESRIPKAEQLILKRWITIGLSESKIGELVEEALAGSGYTTGYRSRIPYIDVKVWIPVSKGSEFESKWLLNLETTLAKWLVGRDDDDLAKTVWNLCPKEASYLILDKATCGQLAARLFGSKTSHDHQLSVCTTGDAFPAHDATTSSHLITISSESNTGAWSISYKSDGETKKEFQETSRYKSSIHAERLRRYVCERSLQIISQWWSTNTPS